jgi:hypothetical protein
VKQPRVKGKQTAKQKRERAAERRKAKAEEARIEALSPAELVEEADRKLTGPAQTIERAEVYKGIMRDWARGYSYAALSEIHGLSERRCMEVVESLRGTRLTRLGLNDPLFGVKFAQDLVIQKSAAVAEYALLADDCAKPGQEHIRLGYLKQRDAALESFTTLVQELGWLPKHLGTLNVQMDAVQMAEAMLDTMDELGVEEDVQRAIVEAIELRVVKRSGRLELAPSAVLEGSYEEVHDGGGADGEQRAGAAAAA